MTIAASPTALLEKHFGTLKDPRSPYRIEHKLIDILIITICATICGANDWEAIAEYGQTKQDWLNCCCWRAASCWPEHRANLWNDNISSTQSGIPG